MRKKNLFGFKQLVFGIEYARLVHRSYYNLEPTPNWYQLIENNYYTFNGMRIGSHSGTDSDDFILYGGILKKSTSFIFAINYERHGVNYKFPPEVKIESRFNFTHQINKLFLQVSYENEYFEHYGFVDSNINVWNETFNTGSIQRTITVLFTVEYRIN